MHQILLESEKFVNYYAIFINREASELFKQFLEDKKWNINYGIRIINAEFDQNISCILIPKSLDYKLFESELFKFKRNHKNKLVKNSEFWGQNNVGYQNKHWTFFI